MIAAGSVAAGVVDRIQQRNAERAAEAEGRTIHKPFGPYEKYFKRPLDFALSAMALIALSPLLLFLTALVRVKLGSPVIFSQERPGWHEKIFRMHKFRSMTDERDENGAPLPDEVRLTPFGKKLRATSLDELPELWNILCGDMSIVGPRPLLVEYLPRYNERQRHRHDVRPGLTGLAQVNGRNALSWEEKFRLDGEYVDYITLWGDMKIVLDTAIKAFIRREGISSETSATMEEFLGSEVTEQ
ncbi:MAG: sugar transferase [Ruminococcaceae bacterium]|nr:sugar transferase [Oscillospiraceae bacterium]